MIPNAELFFLRYWVSSLWLLHCIFTNDMTRTLSYTQKWLILILFFFFLSQWRSIPQDEVMARKYASPLS